MEDIWGTFETSYGTYTDTFSNYSYTEYQWGSEMQWDLWNASTDAMLAGDSYGSYMLNVASLEAGAYSDDAWSTWSSIDTSSYSNWDTGYDTSSYSSSWDTTSYDTSSSYTSSWDTSYE